MAALPQWNLDPASEAVDKKTLAGSYGPITPSSIHGVKEAVTLPLSTKFKYIDDLDEATVAELPPGHEEVQPRSFNLSPLPHHCISHRPTSKRHKFAQWVELQLAQRDPRSLFPWPQTPRSRPSASHSSRGCESHRSSRPSCHAGYARQKKCPQLLRTQEVL